MRTALVDTGCTQSLLRMACCQTWRKEKVQVLTVGGRTLSCRGIGTVQLGVSNRNPLDIKVLVVDGALLGFDLLLGLDVIKQLGGVIVTSTGDVNFPQSSEPFCAAIRISEPDFCAEYDARKRIWTASWKWSDNQPPAALKNRLAEYTIPIHLQEEYNRELQSWIDNGWLLPYPEDELGPPKGLIPLMAVVQENKHKVRPVMDYRELNAYVDAYTANADVCAQKLREWRQQGSNVAIVDLRRAYLQIHVDKSLWPFQTVKVNGQRYCLTRLGFGLNVAPQIMRSVVKAVIGQDETINSATSSYIDDIFVNESVCLASHVKEHFELFGLTCKDPEQLSSGARVLGLYVWEEHGRLQWRRDGAYPTAPDVLTRRSIFSVCGRLTGHFPVCGWLRVATAFLKRRANAVTTGWDDEVEDPPLRRMLEEIIVRAAQIDPTHGDWCVNGRDVTVWVDASSLATGVAIEYGGAIVEDASWLRPVHSDQHINLAELDAVLRGVNLALQWKARVIHLRTDSACVQRWILDTLSGKTRIRTKAASEMLIRRRLSTLHELAAEYGLTIDVVLVRSHANRADPLTRVPQRWLDAIRKETEPTEPVCAASIEELDPGRIRTIHRSCGHPGVKRTLYFARLVSPKVSKAAVREVVRDCEECQSIDPAPVRWRTGRLDVCENWSRVGMDVTHLEGRHYLTLIDCGPSRFAIWRQLLRQDSASIIRQLETIFYERGAPAELLTDNATAFSGETFTNFAERWGVRMRFRCAHVPSGNGIAERSHRTIKRIATRTRCSVMEAVYWYNVTPKDDTTISTAPANAIHTYTARIKGIDVASLPEDTGPSNYKVGDIVWVKIPHGRCTTQFGKGRITKVYSPHSVLVDGTPRHIKDVRPLRGADATSCRITSSDDEAPRLYEDLTQEDSAASESDHECGQNGPRNISDDTTEDGDTTERDTSDDTTEDEDTTERVPLRRSSRLKRPAPHCTLCDPQIREECRCNESNVPRNTKRARTSLACIAGKKHGCCKHYL